MAKYTMLLKDIVEQYGGKINADGDYEAEELTYSNLDEVMDRAIPRIFDFYFPIYNNDEILRKDLCKNILLNYMYDEIAHDTPGMFKVRLRAVLNQIMPKYNGLFELAAIKYNPIYDTDFKRQYSSSGVTTGTDQSNRDSTSKNQNTNTYAHDSNDVGKSTSKYSDTPQGTLQRLEDGTYMSSGSIDDTKNESKSKGMQSNVSSGKTNVEDKSTNRSGTAVSDFEYIVGKRGMMSPAKMILEKEQTLHNIYKMIIDDLGILFMSIWN